MARFCIMNAAKQFSVQFLMNGDTEDEQVAS